MTNNQWFLVKDLCKAEQFIRYYNNGPTSPYSKGEIAQLITEIYSIKYLLSEGDTSPVAHWLSVSSSQSSWCILKYFSISICHPPVVISSFNRNKWTIHIRPPVFQREQEDSAYWGHLQFPICQEDRRKMYARLSFAIILPWSRYFDNQATWQTYSTLY